MSVGFQRIFRLQKIGFRFVFLWSLWHWKMFVILYSNQTWRGKNQEQTKIKVGTPSGDQVNDLLLFISAYHRRSHKLWSIKTSYNYFFSCLRKQQQNVPYIYLGAGTPRRSEWNGILLFLLKWAKPCALHSFNISAGIWFRYRITLRCPRKLQCPIQKRSLVLTAALPMPASCFITLCSKS